MKSEEEIEKRFLPAEGIELPPELVPVMRKAKKYEWITFYYLTTVVIVMYLTLSSSQAMKAAWLEDLLSMVPSAIFLFASKYYSRKASHKYPYGFHRVFSIGFGFGAFALLGMGMFVTIDSVITLIKAEHATIPHIEIFGYQVWFGWIMILALLYSFIPAMILGRKKMPLSEKLHNKLLNVDAEAQKADWMTAAAAIIGIIGIGFGWWWVDPVAALFISISILKDGGKRFYDSLTDFLGQIPTTVKEQNLHKINEDIIVYFENQNWVRDFRIRLREEGEVFLGEVFVIPVSETDLMKKIEICHRELKSMDWKIHEISIQPVFDFKSGVKEEYLY